MSSPKVLGYDWSLWEQFKPAETVAMRSAYQCAEFEVQAIEQTLSRWVEASGLTPTEFAKAVGYSVKRSWPKIEPELLTETLLHFAVTIEPHWLGAGEPPSWFAELGQPHS
jgi:hypothetical protein